MHRLAPCVLLSICLGCASAPPSVPPAAREAAPSSKPAPTLDGAPPSIGVRVGDLSAKGSRKLGYPAGEKGALVQEVLYHSPAQRAGLMATDLIQAVDGTPVDGSCAFLREIAGRPVGATVTLSVRRGGGRLQMAVPLAGSVELFRSHCEQGDGFACQMLGGVYTRLGAGEAAVDAAELYRKACETGYAEGCSALGSAYLNGQGVAADPSRALALFRQACQDGSGSACSSYASQYATGQGVERDDARATDSYSRACDQGDPAGCYHLGLMKEEGRGTERNLAQAVEAYTEACETGSAHACAELGSMFALGEGVAQDAARAEDLYRTSCEMGYQAACDELERPR